MIEGKGILVADDEADFRRVIADHLRDEGYGVTEAGSGAEVLSGLSARDHDLLILDVRMPPPDGLDLLARVQELDGPPEVVILTGHGNIEDAVRAIKAGAIDYLTKPVHLAELEEVVAKAIRVRSLRKGLTGRVGAPALAVAQTLGIVGDSASLRRVLATVERVAPTGLAVLVEGESGTGKELIARAVHALSPRADRPFVALNCGALAPTLVDSELFGHARGAFTGAVAERPGLIEEAAGGTLFVDEVAEMGLDCQPRFLRVLESGEFRRVGCTETRRAQVRLVVATNRSLVEEVHAGRFREDLYHRINGVRIELPPLRRRRDDIPLLVRHFLSGAGREEGGGRKLSRAAAERLMGYSWPGNVRELAHVIRRAVVLSKGPQISPADLRLEEDGIAQALQATGGRLDEIERRAIVAALDAERGNVTRAAARLGVSRRNLHRKIAQYGLKRG